MTFRKGDEVTWKWGTGTARGKVVEVFTEKVRRQIKGQKITRNASEADPAYLVTQEDGDRVLKSGSEISSA